MPLSKVCGLHGKDRIWQYWVLALAGTQRCRTAGDHKAGAAPASGRGSEERDGIGCRAG